jgi:hypothetical protein
MIRENAMITVTPPQFEIPGEMRVVAERSIEQAKLAFDNYMRMTWDASSTFQAKAEANQVDVQAVRNKTMNFIVQNMTLSFEFCQRLVQVKEAEELLRLVNGFLKSQMQTLNEQMMDLGVTLTKMAMSSTKDSQERERAA